MCSPERRHRAAVTRNPFGKILSSSDQKTPAQKSGGLSFYCCHVSSKRKIPSPLKERGDRVSSPLWGEDQVEHRAAGGSEGVFIFSVSSEHRHTGPHDPIMLNYQSAFSSGASQIDGYVLSVFWDIPPVIWVSLISGYNGLRAFNKDMLLSLFSWQNWPEGYL